MKVHAALQNGIVATLCRMCDTRCAINVHLKNGVMVDITPCENHPVNCGRICPRGGAAIDMFYHPERILKPLKKRANGTFEEIPIEQALDEISVKMTAIKDEFGARSVGVWKGEAIGFYQQEEYVRRFVHAFGSPNYFSNDSACYNGRYLGFHLIMGFWNAFPQFSEADLILLFGTNPPMCHPPFMREFADARQEGAKLVVIDPRLNPVACYADIFAQPYPGTDGALGWGLINYLIESKNYDSDLVERHSIGFEKVAAYAKAFTPEYVEQQSGVYRHVLEDIARLIIKNRPRIAIFPGSGLEHHENGVDSARTLAILACLSGTLGQPCGLYRPETMGVRRLTLYDEMPLADQHPIGAAEFPVLYDVRKECHTMRAMDRMLGLGEYPLKGLIITGANPAVSNPNTAKVEAALAKLDLLVVKDLFLTKTARLADYVLPAASFLEREELHFFPKHQLVNLTTKVMAIEGVPDEYSLWHDLAHRLGFGDTCFPWADEHEVNCWLLEPAGVSVETLRQHPEGYAYKPLRYEVPFDSGFPTPSGKLEFASAYLQKLGLPEIPVYVPPYHIREARAEFPFVLTTGARKSLFYHSRHQNIPRFRNVHPSAEMEIHPQDAAQLGIQDQETVRVVSEIGQLDIRATVKHPSELRPGVVEIYHGWEDNRVNFLTCDTINDPISGFPILKGIPVRIEKLSINCSK
jgi:anaerobic selenocysteine-containing dehydrogenase